MSDWQALTVGGTMSRLQRDCAADTPMLQDVCPSAWAIRAYNLRFENPVIIENSDLLHKYYIGLLKLVTDDVIHGFMYTVSQKNCAKLFLSELRQISANVLPERDYVMFGSLLSQFHLSSVCLSACLSSLTLVHRTQGVEAFGNISSPLCPLAILWPPCKILRR